MELETLTAAFNSDPDALSFVWNLLEVTAMFDAIDKGDEFPRHQAEKLMWITLVVLPNNPFYQRHLARLQPLIQSALLSLYQPKFGDKVPERHAMCELAKYVALIIGGPEHARAHIGQIQALFEAV
jgi:hypothetical protein